MGFEGSEYKKELIRFAIFCILICVIWCVYYAVRVAPEMADPDPFFRMNRVTDLYEGGGWYQTINFRSNAPYGETLHWTRPFDILLLAGALPATVFVDFRTALFWWGVIISPVLLVAMLLTMLWAARPLLSRQGPFLLGILLFFQVGVMGYCSPGRCDYHSLRFLLFVALFGFGLRLVSGPVNRGLCCAAGVVAGLSIWAGMDLILVVFAIAAILGLLWIWENGDFARKSAGYSIWLFAAVGISLLAERGWNNLAIQEFDRLSIVHWSVCGFLAGFWIIVGLINRFSQVFGRQSTRLVFAAAGAGLSAICILFLFPKMSQSVALSFLFPRFFGGQVADVDPRVITVWYEKISELQHIFSRGAPITMSVQLAGTALVSAGILVYLLWSRGCRNKRGWGYVLILLFIYIPLSIYRIRWTPYAQILLMLPMAEMMDRALKRIEEQKRGVMRIVKNISVVAAFSATFLILGLAAAVAFESKQDKKVSIVKMCRYLETCEKWQGKSVRILTDTNFGPEILYRTRHETIGSPNQRNYRGILDTYDIMTAVNDDAAHELIEQRRIDLILLCFNSREFSDYSKAAGGTEFYQRLFHGEYPNWIEAVELPTELSASFKLFEMRPKAAPKENSATDCPKDMGKQTSGNDTGAFTD
jgi:hypothetical protein